MYKIVYTKTAAKDVPKLKAAHLADKAKALIDIIRDDPFQKPPPYEKTGRRFERRIQPPHQFTAQTGLSDL